MIGFKYDIQDPSEEVGVVCTGDQVSNELWLEGNVDAIGMCHYAVFEGFRLRKDGEMSHV
jgi:hypothetical protein